MIRPVALLAVLTGLATAALARAEEPHAVVAAAPERACDRTRHRGLGEGPVVVGFSGADLGTGRRACLRSELSLAGRAGAIIDTPNFYGALAADAILQASWVVHPRVEVFATLELVHFEFVQNAVLKGTAAGLGQLGLGAAVIALERGRWVLTPYARVMLPTSGVAPQIRLLGGEVGLAGSFRHSRRLEVHGYVGGDLTGAVSAGPAAIRGGALLALGLQYSPWTWLGLALDLHAGLGHRAALDHLSPAIAVRFRLYRTLGAELSGVIPVAGADRHDVLFALRFHYRF